MGPGLGEAEAGEEFMRVGRVVGPDGLREQKPAAVFGVLSVCERGKGGGFWHERFLGLALAELEAFFEIDAVLRGNVV